MAIIPVVARVTQINQAYVIGAGTILFKVGDVAKIEIEPTGVGAIMAGPGPAPPIFSLELIVEIRDGEGARLDSSSNHETQTLTVRLINFNNGLPEGVFTPLYVGQIGGKAVKLSFAVIAVGDEGRVIHYTLTLGD